MRVPNLPVHEKLHETHAPFDQAAGQETIAGKIAELAGQEQTGARGLMTVCERVLRHFKYELPSTHLKRFEVTRELVEDPEKTLQRLLAANEREERSFSRQLVYEFADRFYDSHKLRLRFTDDAADLLAQIAEREKVPVRELCADRFKDFQFGLRLIAQNSGQQDFVIEPTTVDQPDKTLSEWVVASYTEGSKSAGVGS